MSYTIDRLFDGADFDEIETRTREALAASGFGVQYSPCLALGMVFLPGFPSSACPI